MTSIGVRTRQVNSDTGYYMPIADIRGTLIGLPSTVNGGMGGCPAWALTTVASGPIVALISSAGAGLLKDMGKTIVSSTRVFRKVQLVVPSSIGALNTRALSTFGVGGDSPATLPAGDYFTAYIELGSEGSGNATRVALFGR